MSDSAASVPFPSDEVIAVAVAPSVAAPEYDTMDETIGETIGETMELSAAAAAQQEQERKPAFVEPLLQPDENRFVMFPIQHHDVWDLYKRSVDSFWKTEDIDFSKDLADWKRLTDDERNFIKQVLAFFAASDGVIVENLALRFMTEVQSPEVRAFYGFQNFMENIHCVTGDTKILTDKGYFPIKDLENTRVNIWNGEEFTEVEVKYTGNQAVYNVTLSNGMALDCTSGHKWLIRTGNPAHPERCNTERIETQDLTIGSSISKFELPVVQDGKDPDEFMNPYMHGFFCGDGTYTNKYPMIMLYDQKRDLLPHFRYNSIQETENCIKFYVHKFINKPKYEVPINYSIDTKLRWLEGYVDADGCVNLNATKDASSIQISSIELPFLKDIQLLLTTLGILSNIKIASNAMPRLLPKNDGSGEYAYYDCKKCYVLYISTVSVHALMGMGFSPKRLHLVTTDRLKDYGNKVQPLIQVESIEKVSDDEPTYCFNEPKLHTGIFNGILTGQSETYSLMIETYIDDQVEKMRLFHAVEHYPAIKKKSDWARRWISDGRSSFSTRLLAFAIVEGVYFSSSFAAIFWLKRKNVLPGLCLSNEYISRDEGLHVEHAVMLYNKLKRKVPKKRFVEIMKEAVDIEIEFITVSIPCRMIGMNADLMVQYIRFVADRLSLQMGYDKIYGATNPFDFMEHISIQKKTNFFEHRVSEYALANKKVEGNVFDFDADF